MKKIAVHATCKNKFGITLEVVGGEEAGTFLLPWNECQGVLENTDDPHYFYYVMDDEAEKLVQEQHERMLWLTHYLPKVMAAVNNPFDLERGLELGSICDEYLKKFPGKTMSDMVNDAQQLQKLLFGGYHGTH